MNRFFDLTNTYILGGFALVALYLVATHPNGLNTLLRSGFGGINAGFKTLQGR